MKKAFICIVSLVFMFQGIIVFHSPTTTTTLDISCEDLTSCGFISEETDPVFTDWVSTFTTVVYTTTTTLSTTTSTLNYCTETNGCGYLSSEDDPHFIAWGFNYANLTNIPTTTTTTTTLYVETDPVFINWAYDYRNLTNIPTTTTTTLEYCAETNGCGYLNQTWGDARYVNIDGDNITGNLELENISFNHADANTIETNIFYANIFYQKPVLIKHSDGSEETVSGPIINVTEDLYVNTIGDTMTGDLVAGQANITTINSGHIIPFADDTYSIGNYDKRFQYGFYRDDILSQRVNTSTVYANQLYEKIHGSGLGINLYYSGGWKCFTNNHYSGGAFTGTGAPTLQLMVYNQTCNSGTAGGAATEIYLKGKVGTTSAMFYPGTTKVVNLGGSSNSWDNCYCDDYVTTSTGWVKGDKSALEVINTVYTNPLTGEIEHSLQDSSVGGSDQTSLNKLILAQNEAIKELQAEVVGLKKALAKNKIITETKIDAEVNNYIIAKEVPDFESYTNMIESPSTSTYDNKEVFV